VPLSTYSISPPIGKPRLAAEMTGLLGTGATTASNPAKAAAIAEALSKLPPPVVLPDAD